MIKHKVFIFVVIISVTIVGATDDSMHPCSSSCTKYTSAIRECCRKNGFSDGYCLEKEAFCDYKVPKPQRLQMNLDADENISIESEFKLRGILLITVVVMSFLLSFLIVCSWFIPCCKAFCIIKENRGERPSRSYSTSSLFDV